MTNKSEITKTRLYFPDRRLIRSIRLMAKMRRPFLPLPRQLQESRP